MPILPVESESSVEGTLGGLYLQLGCS